MIVRIPLVAAALTAALSATGEAQDIQAPRMMPPPAGEYTLDPAHGSVIVRVDHMGFSGYPIRFTRFDIQLDFNPQAPETMSVTASIDPASLETHYPGEDVDFDAVLTGPQWLDVESFPAIGFVSHSVELTGPDSADVTGTLSMMGFERTITLQVTYNGGYAGMAVYDPQARIGFSATAEFNRSDFGLAYGIPAEGSSFGVADRVTVSIEAELIGPPLEAPPAE
ncbi:hypothetical protein AWH62_03935 [Maricaulis sp. W15]|uniref:YceI family protein n=1 Tax=Maricaulis sp. W15 TaxID=1772333 RepID=UPI000948B6EF|nr:YceI family protein [Maricaulis sp. W15]OLF77831.1 hypothetical protein AWH62_03935 [Maricaulis sp. W15]